VQHPFSDARNKALSRGPEGGNRSRFSVSLSTLGDDKAPASWQAALSIDYGPPTETMDPRQRFTYILKLIVHASRRELAGEPGR